MIIVPLILLTLVRRVSAGGWDDFSNNIASDLAPIITLFGEQISKQYLSESTSLLDNAIFAFLPIGVLTAVVSTIRICGNSSLKAFIGRAQEGDGVAEAELCSSTSDSVCELWSGGGITRVFGRPKLLEFIHLHDSNDKLRSRRFYPNFAKNGEAGTERDCMPLESDATCGLYKSEQYLRHPNNSHWEEVSSGFRRLGGKDGIIPVDANGEKHNHFAPNPNLSFNIGISKPAPGLVVAVAVLGVSLFLSFIGFAAWATYVAMLLKSGNPIPAWAFPIAMAGSVFLVFGMFLCAFLIERSTAERVFQKKVRVRHLHVNKFE